MKTVVLSGVGFGVVVATLSITGNLLSGQERGMSTFPDLLTLLSVPVVLTLALGLVRRELSTVSRSLLRRAGMVIVGIGAAIVATASLIFGVVRFGDSHPLLLLLAFAFSFVVVFVAGSLWVLIASIWLVRRSSPG